MHNTDAAVPISTGSASGTTRLQGNHNNAVKQGGALSVTSRVIWQSSVHNNEEEDLWKPRDNHRVTGNTRSVTHCITQADEQDVLSAAKGKVADLKRQLQTVELRKHY